MTIWTIALYTGLAGLLWTILEYSLKKTDNITISFLKNWIGSFFIFSAVVKLVDPIGFSIKLSDYFMVFHLSFLKPFSLIFSFVVLVLEFVIGVNLLLNAFKKITHFLLLSLIIFFTLLTGVSALFNVVQDCGCFGDFLKIAPLTSFLKDIVLLVMTIIVIRFNDSFKPLFSKKVQLALVILATLSAIAFTLHNYFHLPIWDFRPYKVGTYIPDQMQEIKPPVYENRLLYKHSETGEEKMFVNTFPQDTVWKFVKREPKLIEEGIPAPIHDFVFTANTGEDITEQILQFEKPILLIIIHDVQKAKDHGVKKIARLLNESDQTDKFNYAFVSPDSDETLETWKKEHEFTGSNLSADATMLKTIVRSNPGLVLLKKGTIIGKWHYADTPSVEDFIQQLNE